MTVAFRAAEEADMQFIVSTWSRSFKGSNSAGMIATEDWESVMHPQIRKALARRDVRTIVAYEKTDGFLYGWIAGDVSGRPPVVFYVYVKENYRRSGYVRGKRVGDGYARCLFAALGVDPSSRFHYVCWVPAIKDFLQAGKLPYAKHDPQFVRYPKPEPRTVEWKR